MRLLVCGDRNWIDHYLLFAVLDRFHAKHHIDVLIEGCARGGDWMAGYHAPGKPLGFQGGWAYLNGIEGLHFPADWETYPKAAGPIRNRQMLNEGKPDYVIGFHYKPWESKGTKDMMQIARAAGVPTLWIPKYEEPANAAQAAS